MIFGLGKRSYLLDVLLHLRLHFESVQVQSFLSQTSIHAKAFEVLEVKVVRC